MNTIHTFGDSFTFGHGCVENCSFKEYYKYKEEAKTGDLIVKQKLARLHNFFNESLKGGELINWN